MTTAREDELRDAMHVAVENLEEERLEPVSRIRIALGVLRTALRRDKRRRSDRQ